MARLHGGRTRLTRGATFLAICVLLSARRRKRHESSFFRSSGRSHVCSSSHNATEEYDGSGCSGNPTLKVWQRTVSVPLVFMVLNAANSSAGDETAFGSLQPARGPQPYHCRQSSMSSTSHCPPSPIAFRCSGIGFWTTQEHWYSTDMIRSLVDRNDF